MMNVLYWCLSSVCIPVPLVVLLPSVPVPLFPVDDAFFFCILECSVLVVVLLSEVLDDLLRLFVVLCVDMSLESSDNCSLDAYCGVVGDLAYTSLLLLSPVLLFLFCNSSPPCCSLGCESILVMESSLNGLADSSMYVVEVISLLAVRICLLKADIHFLCSAVPISGKLKYIGRVAPDELSSCG